MEFSHTKQIEYIDELMAIAPGILDRNILTDMQKSIADSKSHALLAGNQIKVNLPLTRYRAYMDFIVTSEQSFIKPQELVKQYAKFLNVNLEDIK